MSCSSATAGASSSSLTAVVFQSWVTMGRCPRAIVRAVRVSASDDEHLSAAVRGDGHRAERRAADVERLLPVRLAGRARALRRQRHQVAVERADLGERHLARLRVDDLLGALGRRGRLALAERLLEPLERGAQLELPERLAQPRAVRLARGDVVEVDLAQLHVADRGGELLRDARVLGVVREVLLALGAGDLARCSRAPPPGRRAPGAAARRSSRRSRERPGCCPRCRPSAPRSRGSARARSRTGRSPRRGRRPSSP